MKSKTIKIVAILLPIIGIVFGIILGMACKVDVSDDWWTEDLKFNIGLMLETWIFFDLLAVFFGWLSSVLSKLENIEKTICGTSENKYTKTDYFQPVKTAVQEPFKSNFVSSEKCTSYIDCPKCGETNSSQSKFCYKCGILLTQAPPQQTDTRE